MGIEKIDGIEVVESGPGDGMHFRPLLYIAGPMLSEGHPYDNIGMAIELAELAYERGWAPFVPHCDALITIATGVTDKTRFMDVNLAILAKCRAVCILPFTKAHVGGVVTGTAEEIIMANSLHIPVYTEESLPWVN